MADLRIVDAPEIPTENITGEEKLPTGGSGNYSITLDSVADYTKTKKDLADNTSVDNKVSGVRQELDAHVEDLLNPHQVTKGQIGLGNVDNTADADKPVSNSTQAAIISAVVAKADKTYVDNQLTLKANKADVYTKAETYTKQESSDLVNNGISTALTPVNTALDLAKRGIANRYDSLLTYNSGERVVLTSGDIVKSTIDGNTNDPNVDMTGWAFNYEGYVTPEMFGAKGDGVTDDSVPFKNMYRYVLKRAFLPTTSSTYQIRLAICLTSDKNYRLATPRSLMPSDLETTKRFTGLTLFSFAPARITFDYDGDEYLLYNNNQFMFTTFRNITFTCASNTSKFLYSTANGGAQDYYFERCNWSGTWQKLYVLRGVDNNSEWGFQKCHVDAKIRDVMLDVDDSDQFLNFWWNQCKLWLRDGQCIRANKGGHFKFFASDFSGMDGSRELCTSTKGKYLFELNGTSHNRGVCSFVIVGGRFECKAVDPTSIINTGTFTDIGVNARFLYSEWPQGNIDISADLSSNLYDYYDNEYSIHINPGSASGAALNIHNSQLIGKIKLSSGVSAYNNRKVNKISNTRFWTAGTILSTPSDFILIESTAANTAVRAAVELIGCDCSRPFFNVATKTLTAWDLTLGNRTSIHGSSKNIAYFQGDLNGGNPLNGAKCYLQLPPNSIISKITIENDGIVANGLNCAWTVADDASGTVILTPSGNKTLSTRWIEKMEIPFRSTSGKLSLYDANASALTVATSGFRCWVEFSS